MGLVMISAIPKERQGQRLSAALLADALRRAFESANTVGSSMVVVDALDDAAVGLYATHGVCAPAGLASVRAADALAAGTAER